MKRLVVAASLVLASLSAFAANPQVELITSKGKVVIELYPEKAPLTVANFLQYVNDKQYDGTIFHRVIRDFMIQGGGMDAKMTEKSTRPAVKNEAKIAFEKGLKNDRGTIAMARTADPDSATAQFFINSKNNDFLNYPSRDGYGYTVFGRVITGLQVVDQISVSPTAAGDVPVNTITIQSARELNKKAAK
jgi:peptidyl-prolyl cis-trans isomerase A (cyclophilin A)